MVFVCLSLCGCQPTEKAAEPTAGKISEPTDSMELGKKMERAQANMPQVLPEKVEQTAKQQKELQEAMKQRRKGCVDDQSDAYLQLPLKVVDPVFRPCAVTLSTLTQVPLMLPPSTSTVKDGASHLYAYFGSPPIGLHRFWNASEINLSQYSLSLTWTPFADYPGDRASFTGETITADSPALEQLYKDNSELARSAQLNFPYRYVGAYPLNK
jgi:hypothetical protein